MKHSVILKKRVNFPTGGWFDDKFLNDVGKLIEASILENIKTQTQADGSGLQRNKPSTSAKKRAMGRRLLSLVDEKHRFVKGQGQSWKHETSKAKGMVTVRPATDELRELVKSVQIGGNGRNKYRGWFGINKKAAAAIRQKAREMIKRLMKKLNK